MKKSLIAALVFLSACQSAEEKQETSTTDTLTTTQTAPPDTVYVDTTTTTTPDKPAPATPQVYSNETFKDVKVKKEKGHYVVSG